MSLVLVNNNPTMTEAGEGPGVTMANSTANEILAWNTVAGGYLCIYRIQQTKAIVVPIIESTKDPASVM